MGAWGPGSFDNDTALDFLGEVEREGVDAVIDLLEQAHDDEPDADIGSSLIAAAELVCAARGRPAANLPKSAARVAEELANEGVEDALVKQLTAAVRAVAARGELFELWMEEDGEAWQAAVADLLARLGHGPN